MNLIHIFRAGTHTDMHGRRINFSDADLNEIAQNYNPALHEAPVVVGHPKTDAPSYAWVRGIKKDRDGLKAEPRDIDPQFAELVKNRRYSKVSASFYCPDSPGNPTPGKYYLRHVGFLGAQPPAIKGLKPVSFAEDEEGVVEFADWSLQTTASLFSRIRDFLISQFGLEKADSVVPDYMIDSLRDEAIRTETPVPAFSDPAGIPADEIIQPTPEHQAPTPPEEPAVDKELQAKLQKENDDLKRQLEERNKADAQRVATERHNANVAFADSLVSDARLAPAGKGLVVAVLDALGDGESPVSFSENGSEQPLVEAFKAQMQKARPLLDFGEVATGDKADRAAIPAEFAEADPVRLELHTKAVALAKAENITYEAAVARLM
ncbi:peptidase [Salmonella enterica subsp. enterica]|uniref:Peptidase n=2 Tax=Salmonella enterica TaxID=28901 RepID=A0A633DAV4_SALER|nr:peptidase [Salmonella enterica]EAS0615031.1 peptidase [Salmonella enterica subsp. enterica serovar Dahomey]EBA1164502.1 peptidase [Salmonella enterica subsp. enterica]EBF8622410.1 peptidase [Salmonella enterica subsp. enterica serovar Istanbul]EBQ9004272.1 peptidase [Salmonella enterica subsp. enterica serovar Blockley]EBU8699391.1 peptidase [Salmonella enterica subsp. enterica serovar Kokomlemle]EBY7079485.1 peptidase [Salmonella enterica subsp. enterica serovar Ealing]EBZ5137701.1 pepti